MKHRALAGSLLVGLGLLINGAASAQGVPVPPAVFTVSLSTYDDGYYMSGNSPLLNENVNGCLNLNCATAAGSASNILNGVGNNTVSISGSATGGSEGSGASSDIVYYFEAVGPANTPVAFDIQAFGLAGATGNATAFANLYLNNSFEIGEPAVLTQACSSTYAGLCGSAHSSFYLNSSFGATSDTVQELELNVDASANQYGGTYAASLDPTISIDPAFLAANPGFTLELSSNVTQLPVAPVPLPGTLPLLAAGIGACSLLARRRPRPVDLAA